jgi:hypothetical protein
MTHTRVMSSSNSENKLRRRTPLPSANPIEAVYPQTETAAVAAPGQATRSPWLHVCTSCGGELVHPLDWSEEHPDFWRILLRCPECEEIREGVFGQAAVERLDEELDRATAALLSDLRRMTHANMAQEIDFFVRALQADVIVPSDF